MLGAAGLHKEERDCGEGRVSSRVPEEPSPGAGLKAAGDDGTGGADMAVRGDSTGSYEQWRTAGGS